MEIIFKLLNILVWCGTAVAIVWGLLSVAFRSFRMSYGVFLFCFSYLLGIQLWLICAEFVHAIWGIPGLIIGILLFGMGVVPLALLAASIHGAWSEVAITILSLVLIFVCRWGGQALFDKDEASRNAAVNPVGDEIIGVENE